MWPRCKNKDRSASNKNIAGIRASRSSEWHGNGTLKQKPRDIKGTRIADSSSPAHNRRCHNLPPVLRRATPLTPIPFSRNWFWLKLSLPCTLFVSCPHKVPQPIHFYSMDVSEDRATNTVSVILELPGLKREDIHTTWDNGEVMVWGETPDVEEGGYSVGERNIGAFCRCLRTPPGTKVSMH